MLPRGAGLVLLGLLMGILATRLGLVAMTALVWTGLSFIAVGVAYGLPDPTELRRFLDALPRTGTTLIHCAQGHGRTATVSACLLIQHDDRTAEAAIAEILAARPRAHMNHGQRAFVAAYATAWRSRTSSSP